MTDSELVRREDVIRAFNEAKMLGHSLTVEQIVNSVPTASVKSSKSLKKQTRAQKFVEIFGVYLCPSTLYPYFAHLDQCGSHGSIQEWLDAEYVEPKRRGMHS